MLLAARAWLSRFLGTAFSAEQVVYRFLGTAFLPNGLFTDSWELLFCRTGCLPIRRNCLPSARFVFFTNLVGAPPAGLKATPKGGRWQNKIRGFGGFYKGFVITSLLCEMIGIKLRGFCSATLPPLGFTLRIPSLSPSLLAGALLFVLFSL